MKNRSDYRNGSFIERSMRGGYVFHGDCFMETEPIAQRTGEKLSVVFLDIKPFYPLVLFHFSLPCGNYKWLDNPSAQNLPNISIVKRNGHKEGFLKLVMKCQWKSSLGKGLSFSCEKKKTSAKGFIESL